jgi:hypothetical protein
MRIAIFLFLFFSINPISFAFAGGNGSVGSPFQIRNISHLRLLADNVNGGINWSSGLYFIVMEDINVPVDFIIGLSSMDQSFQGYFNGNGKRIMLDIDYPTRNYVGLFAYV